MSQPIKKPEDLITSPYDVRKGFLTQALFKESSAHQYLAKAEDFRVALLKAKTVDDVSNPDFFSKYKAELIATAGFSEKATNHLSDDDLQAALKEALNKFHITAGKNFVQELVYRYLLTKGDALGGTSRNKIGALAGNKLAGAIIQKLKAKKIEPEAKASDSGKVQSLIWPKRFLAFDYKPKLIDKNIDAILLDTTGLEKITKDIFNDKNRYLACGELKGGIDPAGADEHWKTASGALDRIRKVFADDEHKPQLFFVGAAIELSMAKEIFSQLQEKRLASAANLNSDVQFDALISWLISL